MTTLTTENMTELTPADIKALLLAMRDAIHERADQLTSLDQAIGDGDHGINMTRGFDAVVDDLDAISAKPLPDALKAAGMKLVMSVGGASGPLYGTLFMTLGKQLPVAFGPAELANAFFKATEAVAARGKSHAGEKTMLDVLFPVAEALRAGKHAAEVSGIADGAADSTIGMKALRGRASFLGDRSVGHMDPGSCSAALLIGCVAAWAENRDTGDRAS